MRLGRDVHPGSSGASYARLQFGAGPGGSWEAPVEVSYQTPFPGSEEERWQAEYATCVTPIELERRPFFAAPLSLDRQLQLAAVAEEEHHAAWW